MSRELEDFELGIASQVIQLDVGFLLHSTYLSNFSQEPPGKVDRLPVRSPLHNRDISSVTDR